MCNLRIVALCAAPAGYQPLSDEIIIKVARP